MQLDKIMLLFGMILYQHQQYSLKVVGIMDIKKWHIVGLKFQDIHNLENIEVIRAQMEDLYIVGLDQPSS